MKKTINILGIHFGHNASIALLQNGEIVCAINEERFNRIKNSAGFPNFALKYILDKFGHDIDYYVFSQHEPSGYNFLKKHGFKSTPFNATDYGTNNRHLPIKTYLQLKYCPNFFYRKALRWIENNNMKVKNDSRLREEMEVYFSSLLDAPREKILYVDHHTTHALSTKFFTADPNEKTLTFTLDGEGDCLSATVSILDKNKHEVLSRVSKSHSLGYLYREVTGFLGMKPDEHEFKVMGLAPYAKKEHVEKLLPVFQKILWLNESDEFQSTIPMPFIKFYLRENLLYERFDTVAGALQMFTESIVVEWIRRWIKKTRVQHVGLAGGVFMNVKLNQKIAALEEVETCTIVPSAGDETTVLGACYFGYRAYCEQHNLKQPEVRLRNLYLGNDYDKSSIKHALEKCMAFGRHNISEPEDIEATVAKLLAENKVVARHSGKMEFGARALGNRSILAHPASFETVRIINEMIKNRDFWMPFAASILEEDANRYLINEKNIDSPYMAITFNTTPPPQQRKKNSRQLSILTTKLADRKLYVRK